MNQTKAVKINSCNATITWKIEHEAAPPRPYCAAIKKILLPDDIPFELWLVRQEGDTSKFELSLKNYRRKSLKMTDMKLSVDTGSRILEEHLPDFTSKFAESDILINIVHDFSDEKPLIIQLQFHCQPIKSPLANTSSGLVTFTRDLVTPVKYCWQHADKEYHPRPLQSKTLAADLERELFNTELANWTLVCEGTELPCNTFMLGTRSPVFKAMFSQTGFVENQEKRTEISDITLSTAKALLRFIYTDEVTLTEVNVSKLFIAAHKYDIPHLSYICSKHMLESIAVDNAAYYFALGHLYDDPEMKSATSRFIAENIKQVKETSGWQGLKEDLATLEELTTELCIIASQI